MSSKKTQSANPTIDDVINVLLSEMQGFDAHSDEYAKMVTQLEKLHAMKASEKKPRINVSPDALVAVFGNLAGIGLILNFEKLNVITTKALGFVLKSRV